MKKYLVGGAVRDMILGKEPRDRDVDSPSLEFVNVPGNITVQELYESGIAIPYITKTKLRYENAKEMMQSDKYIKPIEIKNKEEFHNSDSTLLSNGDTITLSRDWFGEYKTTIKKSNGKILRSRQRKKKDPLTDIVNSLIEVQPLEGSTGQVFTISPKVKKDNIFKRIWNKIKW